MLQPVLGIYRTTSAARSLRLPHFIEEADSEKRLHSALGYLPRRNTRRPKPPVVLPQISVREAQSISFRFRFPRKPVEPRAVREGHSEKTENKLIVNTTNGGKDSFLRHRSARFLDPYYAIG
jgi:hypothetical protein